MIKLNLGCGGNVLSGWKNYDLYPCCDSVDVCNVDVVPFKLEGGGCFDSSFADYILLSHVFEHITCSRFDFMKELWRILKPGGVVEIRVPVSHFCVEHTMAFTPSWFFNTVCKDFSHVREYKCFRFEKVGFVHNNPGFFGRLFDCFPFLEKCFPLLNQGEYVWFLKKYVEKEVRKWK